MVLVLSIWKGFFETQSNYIPEISGWDYGPFQVNSSNHNSAFINLASIPISKGTVFSFPFLDLSVTLHLRDLLRVYLGKYIFP